MATLSINQLRELFEYDPTSPTGLRWRVNHAGRAQVGRPAGTRGKRCRNGAKSWYVRIQRRFFGAHRIVWMVVHGQEIDDGVEVDHIDGNGLNNEVGNLRLVTTAVNCRNRSMRSDNQTGVVGVHLEAGAGRYRAQIRGLDGRQRSRGFSIAKHGEGEALRMAIDWRAEMVADLNAAGAGYTSRHLGQVVASRISA